MENKDKTTANIAKAYQRYMRLERNFTPNTLDAYMRDIDKLLKHLRDRGIDPTAATLADLRDLPPVCTTWALARARNAGY